MVRVKDVPETSGQRVAELVFVVGSALVRFVAADGFKGSHHLQKTSTRWLAAVA